MFASRRCATALGTASLVVYASTSTSYSLEYARRRRKGSPETPTAQPSNSRLKIDHTTRTTWDDDWDGRADDSDALHSNVTRVVWFVRHGQATAEVSGEDDGARRLTALGELQARRTGERLRELLHAEGVNVPEKITYSTMVRAKMTADIIATVFPKDVERRAADVLREGAPVRPEPDTWRQSEETHVKDAPRIESAFRSICYRALPPATSRSSSIMVDTDAMSSSSSSSSSIASSTSSSTTASSSIPSTTHEIVVCHANVIRYSTLRAIQCPPDAWLRASLYNGSITRVDFFPDGGVSVRTFGDCGFMHPSMLTFN